MTCVTRRAGVVLAAKLPGDGRVIYFRSGSTGDSLGAHGKRPLLRAKRSS